MLKITEIELLGEKHTVDFGSYVQFKKPLWLDKQAELEEALKDWTFSIHYVYNTRNFPIAIKAITFLPKQ